MYVCMYVCVSHNLGICAISRLRCAISVLCILRILRLHSNLKIAHSSCTILRLRNYCAQSSDYANYACTLLVNTEDG